MVTYSRALLALFIGGSRLAFWLFPWLTLDRAAPILVALVLVWCWGRYGLTGQRR